MSAEQNQAVFLRVLQEVFSQGNLDAIDECFTATWIEHQFDLTSDREGFKNNIRYLRASFPDFTLTPEKIIATGDTVWGIMMARGTHQGDLMGHPGTGKPFEITVIDVCRFENGQIVEHWGVPDRFHLLIQLGFIPIGQSAR